MSWLTIKPLSCGSSNTGLANTIKFAFVAPDGTVNTTLRDLTHASANTILGETALGVYRWQYSAMPDGFVGFVYFYLGTIGASPATWPGGITQFLTSWEFSLVDEVGAKAGTNGGLLVNNTPFLAAALVVAGSTNFNNVTAGTITGSLTGSVGSIEDPVVLNSSQDFNNTGQTTPPPSQPSLSGQ